MYRSSIIFLLKITECNNYPGTSPVKSSPSPSRKFPTSPSLRPSPSNPSYVIPNPRFTRQFHWRKGDDLGCPCGQRMRDASSQLSRVSMKASRHFEKAVCGKVSFSELPACFSHERSKFRDLIFSRSHPSPFLINCKPLLASNFG